MSSLVVSKLIHSGRKVLFWQKTLIKAWKSDGIPSKTGKKTGFWSNLIIWSIWSNLTSKIYLINKNLAKLKTFDLVYPNFKGTCIEFINGIMQVCWHFKKGLHWNWQGYFWGNSVKCRKQYKAPTNSIRKLTICIDNAGPQ